jgi:8-amino-7-oxononanoate synthase
MKRATPALEAALSQLKDAQLRRVRMTLGNEGGGRLLRLPDGTPLTDFSSNDYLGLAHHEALAAAMSAPAPAAAPRTW